MITLDFGGGLLLGLASSLHCAGMCGGIAASIALATAPEAGAGGRLVALLQAQAGKAAGYMAAGAALGWAGAGLYGALDMTEAFGILPVFDAPHLGLTFSEADVARPLLCANAQMAELHDRAAEQRIQQLGTAYNTLMVRQFIVQGLSEGEPTRDGIAIKMGVSSRTLQRRLQDEGQTFHEILDDVRLNLANRYLGNEKISLSDVAHLLGFSDQSSFTRAAHRWFNDSPSRVRARLTGRDISTKQT